MEKLVAKMEEADLKVFFEFLRMSKGEGSAQLQHASTKLDIPPVELKLDGPATYLSWSRRVKRALSGRNLEGYLTGEKGEPTKDSEGYNEWKTTHSLLHTWLLNSMITSIAITVDGIEMVSDVWGKLQRLYAGVDNNMRVFQIEREIETVTQGDRLIQEYAADLERLWADYDYFSPSSCCKDPECTKGERDAQRRTMHFMRGLNTAFEPRCAMLLAQPKIPTLDETISAMMQEESRIKLQSSTVTTFGVKSALSVTNPGYAGYQGDKRQCYNCGEIGHLRGACPKPPKEWNMDGRGRFGNRGRGRGTRRGSGRGGYRANLMMAEGGGEEVMTNMTYQEEQEVGNARSQPVQRNQKGNEGAVALAAMSNTRYPDWVVDSGASRHVTGNTKEFLSYTPLMVPERIQTADGTAQPVIGDLPGERDRQKTWDWHMA